MKSLIFFNVYLFLRETERERASRGGAERKGDTESELGSGLCTEPKARHELTDLEVMT